MRGLVSLQQNSLLFGSPEFLTKVKGGTAPTLLGEQFGGKMEWFKFHTIWGKGAYELSDAEAGRLLKAICKYQTTGEIISLSGNERILFSMALVQMKQDAEHNAKVSAARAEAGRIGGLKSKQLEAFDSNCKQKEAKEANALNKELRIKNQELREKNNIAETDVPAPKNAKTEKSSPDDHDFWKFAKENAELAETFYRTTGISPVKSQFGRWVNDCKDLAEAGISAEQLRKTINYMQSENIPLSAPGSCLKTAQYLKARGSVPVRTKLPTTAKYNAFEELAMKMNGIPVPEYDVEVSA